MIYGARVRARKLFLTIVTKHGEEEIFFDSKFELEGYLKESRS